jgi:hypothetical protein
MIDFYKRKQIIELLSEIKLKAIQKRSISHSDSEKYTLQIFEKIGIPIQNDSAKLFGKPGILKELIIDIHNSAYFTIDERRLFNEDFNEFLKLFPKPQSKEELKFRILGNNGLYPNVDIKRGKVWYENFNSRPSIVTINKINSEREYSNESSIYWITRTELKFATSLILSDSRTQLFPYFNPYDTVSLNYEYVKDIPNKEIYYFLNRWLDIKNVFIQPDGNMFNRNPRPDISTYDFLRFDPKESGFNKIFDAFSIRDHLLMRTSNYLLKALMNRRNLLFQEEAILNAFFALEGSLHLLQRKYGDDSTKLNRVLLRDIFKNKLTFLTHGEGTYEFIEEGYFTRISLVHPQPRWGAEWNPYVDHEDFRDYFGISRMILAWILGENEIDFW